MAQGYLTFHDGGETRSLSTDRLEEVFRDFLERYGAQSFLGEDFFHVIDGPDRFDVLLDRCGCSSEEFFADVASQLESSSHLDAKQVVVGGVGIPGRALLPILEELIPGDDLILIKHVEQYELQANVQVPEHERVDLQRVIDTYPVRLSRHTIRQARISRDVGYQYMPFVEELDPTGLKNTWVGQFHQGVLEQMYQNRPIFVLHMSCPVYCRFCFRKHKDCRNQNAPTIEDVQQAIEHIGRSPRIKEIVLTGGEPLLNRKTLTCAVEGLQQIDHIQTIRIASRCISYYPQLFTRDNRFWMNYLTGKNRELQKRNKRIEIATHFIHPDEISHYSLEIISELVKSGIGVYTQTPFLKGCNDSGEELVQLYRELRGAGSEIHYVYIPCSPIQGNKVYWTPLSEGHRAASYLRAHLSDRAMPILCTATKVGKIDWNTSGWAVEPDREDPAYLWIRTPYTNEYFREFVPSYVMQDAREHRDGSIYTRFMADAGDHRLFLGHFDMGEHPEVELNMADLRDLQVKALEDQRIGQQIAESGIPGVWRIHETRVELDVDQISSLDDAVGYIMSDRHITDVLLTAAGDIINSLPRTTTYIQAVSGIPHVNAVRLRSLLLTYEPQRWDDALVEIISDCSRLRAVDPLRIEVETQFIHSTEFSASHRDVIARCSSRGITVYANLLLLSDLNDHQEEMKRICYLARQIGIELFTLYVGGMPLQLFWNSSRPVDLSRIITIATHLRRYQSGREVPLYVVRTLLGDVDFNLTSTVVYSEPDRVFLALHPYRWEYFRSIQEDWSWPEGVYVDDQGQPVVPVKGLTVETNKEFFLYT